jgi:predicted transcriptional regulator
MADGPNHRLGDLQLRIMKVLWRRGPVSVAEVQQRLSGGPLAYTTVATMLRKMEDRGLVRHRGEGRKFIYTPAVTAEEVTRSMSDDLVDRLFAGNLADTVCHLLSTRDVSHDELARLEEMIRARRQDA